MSTLQYARIGSYFTLKAKLSASRSGVGQAAKNLRKQGIPLSIAVVLLAGR